MPFPFTLPTTSSVNLGDYFASSTHPSLPLTATTKRSVVKDALKKHKRLAPRERAGHLPVVQGALMNYIPYLLAWNTASGYREIEPERVDVEVVKPLEVEWRTTLSGAVAGRELSRVKVVGLHHEISFVLSTLAYTHSLLARAQLRTLYDGSVLSPEQRTAAVGNAMKQLLLSHSIWTYLLPVTGDDGSKAPVDVQRSTISALASLALAEATLTVVSKDDPYAAAVAVDRNANDNDWMFKAPSMPKVRALLFARISLAAAQHAHQAEAQLAGSGADEDLKKYAMDLRRTASGKGTRFLAVDAELRGETGEALAWLKGAKRKLGFAAELENGERKGFRGLRQNFLERREDRKISKDSVEWGLDAGRLEESRVVESLETKWDKENSTVNVQVVAPYEPLLASMPSGREYHNPETWTLPTFGAGELERMRAPPEPDEAAFRGEEEDSGGEEFATRLKSEPVGAFPGTAADYGGRGATSSSYY